jgi:hypothetical protein
VNKIKKIFYKHQLVLMLLSYASAPASAESAGAGIFSSWWRMVAAIGTSSVLLMSAFKPKDNLVEGDEAGVVGGICNKGQVGG